MTINSISGANAQMGQMGMNQATDSYSRNIQNQIADAQKQLQELSSNKDMTQEEKMTKRQEIQQQISDLNMQLRQRQMEIRMQARQRNGNGFDEMPGGNQNTDTAGNADMGVLVSLSTTKDQIAGMKKVRTDLEGKLRTAMLVRLLSGFSCPKNPDERFLKKSAVEFAKTNHMSLYSY